VASLDRLFALEIEFHRRLRQQALGTADITALHTSYALQSGYEELLRGMGRVTELEIRQLAAPSTVAGDPRDLLKARDSVARLLGLRPFEA
jgi:hypothetical protein